MIESWKKKYQLQNPFERPQIKLHPYQKTLTLRKDGCWLFSLSGKKPFSLSTRAREGGWLDYFFGKIQTCSLQTINYLWVSKKVEGIEFLARLSYKW